jgi:hypothetical protein
MQSIGFAAPLLPGKTEADLEAMASVSRGERRAEHEASRRRAGIKRESVWLQRTPSGDAHPCGRAAKALDDAGHTSDRADHEASRRRART